LSRANLQAFRPWTRVLVTIHTFHPGFSVSLCDPFFYGGFESLPQRTMERLAMFPPLSSFSPLSPLALGRYPTPVEHVTALSTSRCELWVKRDDLTHDVVGGNKVRKLEMLLAQACTAGAQRIVTVGAAGSHHVLATTYFGKQLGLSVEAVLAPQIRTEHVSQVLRASLALGLIAFPVSVTAQAPFVLATRIAKGARLIPLGGSNTTGALGYAKAAQELAEQIKSGGLNEPDVCVVALGSGGTAAGLAAGFAAAGLQTRVVGICVSSPRWLACLQATRLARACAKRLGLRRRRVNEVSIEFDGRFLGAGYGYPTQDGSDAAREADQAAGLEMDSTYTAKAFAATLGYVRAGRARRVLYWHTLSSASMQPLLGNAPQESELGRALRRLMKPLPEDAQYP
jgi:1-aminocyclopropane-1-carboxylate deaminase/D-cysteine desulfhydrase-like pyridoxal-dependent ACC family enzyme